MAISSAAANKIRYYLGWGTRFRSSDSTLEHAIIAVGNEPAAESWVVSTLLPDLDTVYSALKDAHGRIKAMKVGSINLPGQMEIASLRSEGRRLAGSLAAHLNVQVAHDVFSGSSPRGYSLGDRRRPGDVGAGNRLKY